MRWTNGRAHNLVGGKQKNKNKKTARLGRRGKYSLESYTMRTGDTSTCDPRVSPLKYDEGWWSSRYRIFHISLVKREVNFQPDEKRRAGGCLGPRKWQSRGEKKLEIHLEFQQRQHPGKWRRWEVGGASAQRLLFQSASVIDGQRSGRHTRGRRRDEIEGDDNNCSSKLTLIVGRPFRRPSDASVALCAPWLLRRGAAGHGASGSTWTRWPNWFPPPRTTPGWPTACYYRWPALRPSSSSV